MGNRVWVDAPQLQLNIYLHTRAHESVCKYTFPTDIYHGCICTHAPLHIGLNKQGFTRIHPTQPTHANPCICTHIFCMYSLSHAHIHSWVPVHTCIYKLTDCYIHAIHTHSLLLTHTRKLACMSASAYIVHLSSFTCAYTHLPTC